MPPTAFGRKSDVEAVVSRDGDVVICLTVVADQADVSELENQHRGGQAWTRPSMLLRLGLLTDRQLFAANWDALRHVLVAAPLSQSAEAILSGLVSSGLARLSLRSWDSSFWVAIDACRTSCVVCRTDSRPSSMRRMRRARSSC